MVIDHDSVIEREAAALAAALDGSLDGSLDAAVPGTDWTARDLLDHVGALSWYWASRTRKAGGGDFYSLERPEETDPLEWFREGIERMRTELREAADDAPIKTWAGIRPPSWLWRRMAHELAVHRHDAEAAVGRPRPIEAEVAADGIDEFLEEFLVLLGILDGPDGSLHLHATDELPDGTTGEWFIEVIGGEVSWRRAHAKGDVAVRAPTSDLLLLLWGRVPPEAVEVLGDRGVLDRWRAATRF